jgi:DNA-directed RNA polymerase subunit E"
MSKEKACLRCKMIYQGNQCPNCGEGANSDTFKGKLVVFNPENSEISKNLKISKKGEYAIKVK